jgi:hypothetical protein
MNRELLYRGQRVGALVFAVFLVLHLAAVSASLWGAGAFDTAVAATHAVYGYWPLELVLLAAALWHLGVSAWIWWQRPPGAKRGLTQQLQTWSSFAVAGFILGHVLFLRVAPAVWNFTPDFAYVWLGYEIWPTLFVPLYFLLGTAGAYHLAYGLRQYALRKAERPWHRVVLALVAAFFVAVTVHLPLVPAPRPLGDDELKTYLKPFATFTPWLIGMGEDHPLIRRYQGKPPLVEE